MDMVYVKDVAEMLVRGLLLDHGCYDRIFDISTGRKTTVNETALLVNALACGKACVRHLPILAAEPERNDWKSR